MNRVTEIEQGVWPGESIEQFALRDADALERVEIVRAFRFLVIKQAITSGESVPAQLALEVVDLALIIGGISFARKMLEPDRIQF